VGKSADRRPRIAASRVECADGRIVGLEAASRPLPRDVLVEDGWIAPGLIDLQVNGAGGADLTSASEPRVALEQVACTLARHGVTAFCPTIVSSPLETILRALTAYRPQSPPGGAESLGLHVEGPFIDEAHRGVHEPSVLRSASADEIDRWLAVGPPSLVTLAPERPGGLEAIVQLAAAGVIVSLGHSGADAAQAQAGLAAGARMATHLFNAMPPLHHRRPGLIGALLVSQAALGVIADGCTSIRWWSSWCCVARGPIASCSSVTRWRRGSAAGRESAGRPGCGFGWARRASPRRDAGWLRHAARWLLAERARLAAAYRTSETARYGHAHACHPARPTGQRPSRGWL